MTAPPTIPNEVGFIYETTLCPVWSFFFGLI